MGSRSTTSLSLQSRPFLLPLPRLLSPQSLMMVSSSGVRAMPLVGGKRVGGLKREECQAGLAEEKSQGCSRLPAGLPPGAGGGALGHGTEVGCEPAGGDS